MAGCVSYKEQLIFISGGYNKHEASNHVLQFDPLNENIGFEILPNLMFHRAGHIMTIVNINDEDRLLVIGTITFTYNLMCVNLCDIKILYYKMSYAVY